MTRYYDQIAMMYQRATAIDSTTSMTQLALSSNIQVARVSATRFRLREHCRFTYLKEDSS
jgi:hypothetical protein